MWKKSKKVLDIQENGCYYKQADAWEMKVLNAEQKIKKLLTNMKHFDIIQKLSHETATTKKNIDNWTIDNKPWKFLQEIFQERTSKDVEPEQ